MDTLRWSRYELGFNKEFLWEFLRISNIPTGFAHPNTVDSDCHVSINHGLEYHDRASFSPSMHCRIYINLEYYSLWEDLHHGSSVDQGGELLMIHCPKHNGSSCTLHLKKTSSRSSQHIWVFNWSPGLLGMYYEITMKYSMFIYDKHLLQLTYHPVRNSPRLHGFCLWNLITCRCVLPINENKHETARIQILHLGTRL